MKHTNSTSRLIALPAVLFLAAAAFGTERVSNTTVSIGRGLGTVETEIIDGSGAGPGGYTSWLISPVLNIGYLRGTGTLSILNGGLVSVTTPNVGWASVNVGGDSGSTGTLLVDGDGSVLTATHHIMVGHTGGTGTMRVTNGGAVSTGFARIGGAFVNEPTRGDVTVEGANSSWTINGDLFAGIGPTGQATMSVLDGGSVRNNLGYIGFGTGGRGEVLVSGQGSTWTNTSSLVVGGYGHGWLRIENGGTVTNTYAEISLYGGALGNYVTVSGAGSTWSCTDMIAVGGRKGAAGGEGTLNIRDGAQASTASTLKVWAHGIVNLEGGTLRAPTIDDSGGGAFSFTGGSMIFNSFLGSLDNRGGQLSPAGGGLVGQSTVTGNYRQQSGGVLQIDVNDSQSLDRLTVKGAAELGGLIRVVFSSNPTAPGTYEFLSASAITLTTVTGEAIGLGDEWLFVPDFANGEFRIEEAPKPIQLSVDIRPGSCPNPFNRKSRGVLPVALLGTDTLDVADVDLATIQLLRADGIGGGLAPVAGPPGPHPVIEDVGTPFDGEPCDCHGATGDGIPDLSLKFSSEKLVSQLQLQDLPSRAQVKLMLTGKLTDGTSFEAVDCIVLVP